jgi:hypothetical protein
MRTIIANHDDHVLTAHEFATHSPNSHLPDRVRHLVERRTATVKRRRAHHQYWQAQTLRLAQSMEQAKERHISQGHTPDYGIEL